MYFGLSLPSEFSSTSSHQHSYILYTRTQAWRFVTGDRFIYGCNHEIEWFNCCTFMHVHAPISIPPRCPEVFGGRRVNCCVLVSQTFQTTVGLHH